MSLVTILLLEDVPSVHAVLRAALESEGYAVLDAADGGEGVRLYHEHRPALAIVDIVMPEKDGIEMSRHRRGSGHLHDERPGRGRPGGRRAAGREAGRMNHYSSYSRPGTEAALFHGLIESALTSRAEPGAYLLRAAHSVLEKPGDVALPTTA